ncbi:putative transcription factor [Iris pallida]|uniref:Transcription factor n=1 Tax=Iris pallida TaxID=29817 RepID=A0AAX6FFU6_IRIPA|nr:putative transcription factor [Iris pallida]
MGIRKCSHCGNNGHNSRTCNNPRSTVVMGGGGAGEGVRLFGVQLYIAAPSASPPPPMMVLKKSFSMDCMSSTASCTNYAGSAISPSSSSSSSSLACIDEATEKASSTGSLSDGLMARAQDQIRKKGVPWTEEEHKSFLAGLEKLGKGDWRGISRNFVATRTPTQVASHAQKYFLRLSSLNNKIKRRSSLFDIGSGERAVLHATHEEVPSSYSLDHVKGVRDGVAIDLNSSFSSQYVDS